MFLRLRLSHSVTRAIVFIYVPRMYIDLLHDVLLTMVDTPHCPLLWIFPSRTFCAHTSIFKSRPFGARAKGPNKRNGVAAMPRETWPSRSRHAYREGRPLIVPEDVRRYI